MTARQLGERLAAFATEKTEALLRGPFRNWHVPRVWGGHPVGADVTADLVFTISHLRDAGVAELAGAPIDGALQVLLRHVDGPNTHTFFSYRVAESLLRHGPFAGNHLLAGWTEAERHNLRQACDSTSWIELLHHGLPRNYHAVLARCELGRQRLGLLSDTTQLDELVERTAGVLGANPLGFLDDSTSHFGRYDIYTADVHLFCEPLADRLGAVWERGMRASLDLVRRVASPDGSAIAWGRSTGALSVCLTLELAALAIDREMTDEPEVWLALAGAAADDLERWFDEDGVTTAHAHRSTFDYRGPPRRLQMSVDLLGKIAEAGARLQRGDTGLAALPLDEALVERDELIRFDDRNAGVWAVRTPWTAFSFPLTASTVNDYLPAPHQPHRFEVAVQHTLPCATPVLWSHDHQYVGGGLPSSVEHDAGALALEYEGFPRVGRFEDDEKPAASGRRHVTWRVEGRALVAEERWQFDEIPDAVAWQFAEAPQQPLSVRVESDTPHRVDRVDVDGLKEWRSFWNELPAVHQVDFRPVGSIDATITVTAKLRVASTAFGHHYHRALYHSLRDEVADRDSPWGPLREDDPTEAATLDVFHMHWPEWVAFDDLAAHDEIIATLREHGVRIVWTVHNLTPHAKQPDRFDDVYQRWADAADGVIHHTEWGRDRATARYPFRPDAEHRVIRHGHWGHSVAKVVDVDRAAAEAEFGLDPCAIRLGIIGAPRHEKRVQEVLDGFARTRRDDVQLCAWSLDDGDVVPDDPRIRAWRYEGVDRRTYDRRLRAVDVLVLPFSDGMLATGTAGDAIAHGVAVMASDWGFLAETFGDAALACPLDPDDFAAAVEALTTDDVRRSAEAVAALRDTHDWPVSAARTLDLFDALPPLPRRR